MQKDYVTTALFEHQFWLQIMGDHSRFIHDTLPSKEVQEAHKAEHFIQVFDQLLSISRGQASSIDIQQLNQTSSQHVAELKEFKLHLIRRHLEGKITIGLTPTFINHMVNELEEYQQILSYLLENRTPPLFHPLHHHLLWLNDAIGHSASIEATLDEVESLLIEKGRRHKKHFTDFYLKAVEFAGYLRTNLKEFPALSRFNRQVELEMLLFKEFLNELEETRMTDEVLGILSPLMADHMAREECYYLMKLSTVSEISKPHCNPAHPRNE